MDADARFTDWGHVMALPSQREVAAFRTDKRSPYIVCQPQFEQGDRYTQYAAEFRAEYLPKGTYLCLCCFTLDHTRLKKTCSKCEGAAGYAGFQRLEDGSTCAILSIWDLVCESRSGQKTVIRPKLMYYDGDLIRAGHFDGEGTGFQCLVSYDWKAGRKYRMLLRLKDDESTGASHLYMWAHDFEEDTWTKLIEFDLRIERTFLMTPCAFLENFLPEYAGEIRTMELSNITACSDRGKWVEAKSALFGENFELPGSYQYGVRDRIFWGITTGLPNRCPKPVQWMQAYVK